jgi:hypothetical protein
MTRDEMIAYAKLHYDYSFIFKSLNFSLEKSEILKSGKTLETWINTENSEDIRFAVIGEEEPAQLIQDSKSSRMYWEKFDLLYHFHAGSQWSVIEQLLESGIPLLSGPLAELAINHRQNDLYSYSKLSISERLLEDPGFQREYDKQFRQLQARKAAQDELQRLDGDSRAKDLRGLTEEELEIEIGLLNWEKLWADEEPERWFIKDLLCAGRSHGFPAASGLGKSLLWLDVAAGLSSGRGVLGYDPQAPIRVLYLDHENTPKGDIKPRLKDMGYEPKDLTNFHYLSFPNIDALNTKSGGQDLSQILDLFQPDLVFIDTFSRFVEGDENGSAVAHTFYEHTGRELKRRGIAYLRIDHIGKDASRGARGSSAKIDDLDLIWTMTKTKEPNVFLLKNEKARAFITEDSYLLERLTSPLRHTIKSGISWKDLLDSALRFENAVALIEELIETKPNHSLAQGKIWVSLRTECKKTGISRGELLAALRHVRGEDESVDELH